MSRGEAFGTVTEDDICWLKSEDACTLYVRDHVDLTSFRDACIAYEGCGISQFNEERHTWFRHTPMVCSDGIPGTYLREAEPKSRGAFPVTLMERPW